MSLFFHLLIHVSLSLLAGLIVFMITRKFFISFFPALAAGVAVDIDHLIDYLLAFGFNFRLEYFLNGYQFLKSDKIYILFHGWEYVIILVILVKVFKNEKFRAVFLGLALGLFFHLAADTFINNIPLKSYSIIYRAEKKFAIEELVYPENWKKHQVQKGQVILP